ncbi:hypothetical protein A2Z33_07355 [Candidatus Gottesmanbacteria bacterium RBG_16_52_11]|uniref:thioredoxin-dependent peroxiredoxin n=1 Tax=Candidatus Gottesmanbacteria bacterium RBG_16_52_11 TaxID=1798374 RepID=A0A1F5YY00_9BACT|nr:MAG: hypothetical protein A2Z33_07355 [Candidatus Gottesmanbacteria bacterium RBG_16_52_11]
MLDVGTTAPDFSAADQNNIKRTLHGYRGKWVVIYFYPRDFTSGCIKEACGYRDAYAGINELAIVIGISRDSAESHRRFAGKYGLSFPLLADPEGRIIKAYGAGGVMTRRITYIIDPTGKIAKSYTKVEPDNHARQVSDDLRILHKRYPQKK